MGNVLILVDCPAEDPPTIGVNGPHCCQRIMVGWLLRYIENPMLPLHRTKSKLYLGTGLRNCWRKSEKCVRTNNCPTPQKRVVRFLKGTATFGINFTKENQFKLSGFADSDWAGCVDDMRSTSGFCFTLGSGCFSWSSKKQEVVAQSTAEAEFMAATTAANQAIWLRKLLMDLGFQQEEPTQISVDNQATLAISQNPVFLW
ncbi:hypothetical protein CRG98_038928 [Punica granatum]|uniref:Reverse transcriptase Ty1/copia-type domain-containing protein n=1 Tax=Punica granatum TaxID=22663 RepID=A0A2I0IA41_PUNGR|nr:hypothetical protein CRG98_038928 [Punica granatum]